MRDLILCYELLLHKRGLGSGDVLIIACIYASQVQSNTGEILHKPPSPLPMGNCWSDRVLTALSFPLPTVFKDQSVILFRKFGSKNVVSTTVVDNSLCRLALTKGKLTPINAGCHIRITMKYDACFTISIYTALTYHHPSRCPAGDSPRSTQTQKTPPYSTTNFP